MYTPEQLSNQTELSNSIGEAIVAYSSVEATQARLLQSILKTDAQKAYLIFFAVQNSRARNELFDDLLEIEFKGRVKKYWDSCSSFLAKLALFRNALAHWHPRISIAVNMTEKTSRVAQTLAPANFKHPFIPLEAKHIGPFLVDCMVIREYLSDITSLVEERPAALPEIFQKPIAHQNQAVLRLRPTPKEPPPQRPPSVPKLTKFQKRKKAEKEARERAKKAKS